MRPVLPAAGTVPAASRRLLLGAALGTLARPAIGQPAYPSHPVRIVVPFPPGGALDVLTRILAEKLTARLGQSVVVENRAGAAGLVGLNAVAKAPPDGYTLGVGVVGSLLINRFLYRMPFGPNDLAPIALTWDYANVAVASPKHVAAPDLKALVEWARAQPGGIFYAISSVGTTGHLSTALFCQRAGITAQHVAVGGGAGIQLALTQGQAAFTLDGGVPAFAGAIRGGELRAYAVTSAERWPGLDEVPTMAEAGFPDFVITSWTGFVAPAGTPRPIIDRLAAALNEVTEDEDARRRAFAIGGRLIRSTPEEMQARMEREAPIWEGVVRSAGVKVE
ncbi:tripartite tricarboxylate transporter substrate binding protein [Roseomonas sp. OT10]|uniref:Bug family tripartite tricarboxylate transporter substrate binding protein n=1 Tax=Roseomonas cutis TaxID=2897332 RepID=UPI001E5F60B0|nr:tripartite tricarboxylate transporter substrate binding protein [Roseomonas sp. OT10]UFN48394.1 tripartite tricarboxylate transporter substrate binding protein [Roseomonas sp. OT10]